MALQYKGSCLCGAVRYQISGALRPIIYCHCSQCRKTSGHYVAATAAANSDLQIEPSAQLRWYRSSPQAQRGFCATCGASVFWRRLGSATTSIMAGSLETPTGLTAEKHIFIADKSDYYVVGDALPQHLTAD